MTQKPTANILTEGGVVKATIAHLTPSLAASGFVIAGKKFRRNSSTGFQLVIPLTNQYTDIVELDFAFAIRLNKVESLITRSTSLHDAGDNSSLTSVARTGELRGIGHRFYYHVSDMSALPEMLDDFLRYWSSEGTLYFEQFQQPTVLERAFNETPQIPCIHSRDEARRVFRGLALAGLYNPGAAEHVFDEYRRLYVDSWPSTALVQQFNALAAHFGRTT